MSAWSAHPAKRLAAGAVAGISVVALLGGCGFTTRQQAAVIINGNEISESDVQKTVDQVHTLKQYAQVTDADTVEAIILARLLMPVVNKAGTWKPDDAYASTVAQIPNATPLTKELLQYVAVGQAQAVTQQDLAGLKAAVNSADVSVNPKYGTFEKVDQIPYFTLAGPQPNWLKPTASATSAPAK